VPRSKTAEIAIQVARERPIRIPSLRWQRIDTDQSK
jgi:hypothetical protein